MSLPLKRVLSRNRGGDMKNKTLTRVMLFVCWFDTQIALAQFGGVIQGTVKDPSGAVVPAAKITLIQNETQRRREGVSGAEGFYRFTGLSPGTYTLQASPHGMHRRARERVLHTSRCP